MEEWLRSIELDKRYPAFRDHGITFDQLHDLSEEDLRELGLTIGERKRFRQAVRSLQQPNVVSSRRTPAPEEARAERRPLTVMFVDLVNSSGLGEQLDELDPQGSDNDTPDFQKDLAGYPAARAWSGVRSPRAVVLRPARAAKAQRVRAAGHLDPAS